MTWWAWMQERIKTYLLLDLGLLQGLLASCSWDVDTLRRDVMRRDAT